MRPGRSPYSDSRAAVPRKNAGWNTGKVFQVHSAYQKRYSFFSGLSFQTCLSFLFTPFPSSLVSTLSGVRSCCLPER
ncbi:hypothetical protein CXU21_02950 [Akkermansia muciniphila]|nr:hypothetical protein CXU21_02950 [Akkermansia muciniphila]